MQKILALSAFLISSFAAATNTGPNNLGLGSLCFGIDNIQLQSEGSFLPKSAKKSIFQLIDNKLTAYRIKHPTCKAYRNNALWVQIDELDAGNGAAIFSVEVDVFDNITPKKSGLFSIYNNGGFGRSSTLGTIYMNSITSGLSEYIDQLAADFIKANP